MGLAFRCWDALYDHLFENQALEDEEKTAKEGPWRTLALMHAAEHMST